MRLYNMVEGELVLRSSRLLLLLVCFLLNNVPSDLKFAPSPALALPLYSPKEKSRFLDVVATSHLCILAT